MLRVRQHIYQILSVIDARPPFDAVLHSCVYLLQTVAYTAEEVRRTLEMFS